MMKKMLHITRAMLAILVVALAMSVDATATVYNWSRYDLSFETPDGGFVTYNSPTRFEVHWEDMVMTVQLYSQDKGDEKKMITENLQRKALGYSMYDLEDGKIKVKGFKKTYSVSGTMPDALEPSLPTWCPSTRTSLSRSRSTTCMATARSSRT